jgi:hypothetical protein
MEEYFGIDELPQAMFDCGVVRRRQLAAGVRDSCLTTESRA